MFAVLTIKAYGNVNGWVCLTPHNIATSYCYIHITKQLYVYKFFIKIIIIECSQDNIHGDTEQVRITPAYSTLVLNTVIGPLDVFYLISFATHGPLENNMRPKIMHCLIGNMCVLKAVEISTCTTVHVWSKYCYF